MRGSWGSGVGAVVFSLLAAVAPAPAARTTPQGVALGAKLFATECAGCHGPNGDGKGVADPEMQPRPRDLTSGKFKLRSTSTGTPISNAELLATITNGIAGTAMPSFRFLSESDRRQLVEYVASIAHLPEEDNAVAVEIPPAPPASPQLIEAGKQLYADLGCPACHGPTGRGDGAASPFLRDEWGSKTPPRDLTTEPLKGGDSERDLYLRFAIGIPGTPMPSYADAVSPEKLWALVFYVKSLRPQPGAAAHPAAPIAWGKQIVAEKHCLACHSLPRPDPPGREGGAVGPPLDLEARLLNLAWMKEYLEHPRAAGKIYPSFVYRMPDLALSAAEAGAVIAYLTSVVGRAPAARAATPAIDAAEAARGMALYAGACAACHKLGDAAATAPSADQGPDLTFAAKRYDYDFVLRYVADPTKYDAAARMPAPKLDAAEIAAVVQYVWKGEW